jgi:Porin subfamily
MEVEMKMVKSLLLGTAAGLVAVAGAQAADMPVKAAPVQYVKICSLYGDGFYYVPGTDICLKVGGYVRGEYAWPTGVSITNGPFQAGSIVNGSGYKDRFDGQDFVMRTRAYAWFDSRQQTEYGTLRTYFQIGLNYDSPNSPGSSTGASVGFSANRAFIQFAGFTIGTAQSFFDFYSSPASAYWGALASDTGDSGWKVFAYTLQFGNGISTTFSIEEPRVLGGGSGVTATAPVQGVINTNLGNALLIPGTGALAADRAKERFPDIVQNWRVDQAWGSAQIMGAVHDASGGYYADTLTTLGLPGAALATGVGACATATSGILGGTAVGTTTGSEVCGHPADKLGWAVGGGTRFNLYQGDYFQWQATYTQGATRYVNHTQGGAFSPMQTNGGNLGYGFLSDGVFSVATGDVQLTTAFGVNAAYDHLWLPNFRTSVYGAWTRYQYNDSANLAICQAQTIAAAGAITFTPVQVARGLCNNDFSWWQVGSRTQYNFTPWFYVGFDVKYERIDTASNGAQVFFTPPAGVAKPAAVYTVQNQDNYAVRIRVHRDIVP